MARLALRHGKGSLRPPACICPLRPTVAHGNPAPTTDGAPGVHAGSRSRGEQGDGEGDAKPGRPHVVHIDIEGRAAQCPNMEQHGDGPRHVNALQHSARSVARTRRKLNLATTNGKDTARRHGNTTRHLLQPHLLRHLGRCCGSPAPPCSKRKPCAGSPQWHPTPGSSGRHASRWRCRRSSESQGAPPAPRCDLHHGHGG